MQITYFPYLTMSNLEVIPFGDIKVWNFDKKAEEFIPDDHLRNKVQNLLESNVKNGRALNGIGVLSIGATDFHQFSEEEFNVANEVRLLLFLSFLAKNNVSIQAPNAGHFVATSENFTFVMQNFEKDSEYIAQRNGFIVKMTDGGWKICELKFHAPPYVIAPLRFSLDGELITKILGLKKKNKRLYQRILRSTDLLFESYFNDPYVSLNARQLLQVGAFEVLLDLPEQGQRKDFKDKIKKYTVRAGEKSRKYHSERLGKTVVEQEPLKVVWADKFYTLRNHIIHGQKVPIREFYFQNRQSHLDIGPMFFVLVVKELINEKLRLKRKYFTDELIWERYNDGFNDREGFVYKDSSSTRSLARRWRALKARKKKA